MLANAIRRGSMAAVLAILAACGGGGSGGSGGSSTTGGENRAPRAVLLASGDVRSSSTGVNVTVGGLVYLNGGTSMDEDHDTLSYEWTLLSKPAGSASVLPSTTATSFEWRPDVLGAYTVQLKVADPKGAVGVQQMVVTVDNRAPTSSVVITPQFTPVPSNLPPQAVTIGANVLLNGAGSTDPDGDPVTIAFELSERPTGSAATLDVVGNTARLVPDLLGSFKVKVLGYDGRGASFESNYTIVANNRTPNPVVLTGITPYVGDGGQSMITTSVGYDVLLDGSTSSDPDGDAMSREWILTSKPVGSTATLSTANGLLSGFSPDAMGDYVVALTATDTVGAKSVHTVTVRVNNRRPTANASTNATPRSLTSGPTALVPLGTEITLRGSSSTDADGHPLTYAWTVDSRPALSTALLSATSVADPKFVADREGQYVFRLRVTDTEGAYSERTVTLNVGTHAPVAVVDRGQITLMAGMTARASAALSFDEDGDALTYQWTLDAKPVGSATTIPASSTAALALTPDLPGVYVAAVTVRDATASSIAYVTIRVLSASATSVSLGFAPDNALYSVGLDKLVAVATAPDSVRIIDPFTAVIKTASLPAAVKNFSLSPDGKLAVVLHEGLFSLIDLETASVIRTTASGGAQTDAFVTNDGIVFLIGQTGGQWVSEPVVVINGRTGVKIIQSAGYLGGTFYGTQYGVFANRLNKVFFMSLGLSPGDISYFAFNPATAQVTHAGDSPYHGDFAMNTPLFLNDTQDYVFTVYGTFFRTDTLTYAGRLSGISNLQGFSHSAFADEALALQNQSSAVYPYNSVFASSYKRFHGSLLLPDGELPLPTIGGDQAYGIKVFHSAAGKHVLLVQTGSNEYRAPGAQYHVIVR